MQITSHSAGVKTASVLPPAEEKPDDGFDEVIGMLVAPAATTTSGLQPKETRIEAHAEDDSADEALQLPDAMQPDEGSAHVTPDADPSVMTMLPTPPVVQGVGSASIIASGQTTEEKAGASLGNAGTKAPALTLSQAVGNPAAAEMNGLSVAPLAEAADHDVTEAALAHAAKTAVTPSAPDDMPTAPQAYTKSVLYANTVATGPRFQAGQTLIDQSPATTGSAPRETISAVSQAFDSDRIPGGKATMQAVEITALFRQYGFERESRAFAPIPSDLQAAGRGALTVGSISGTSTAQTQITVAPMSPLHHPPPVQQVAQAIATAFRQGSTGQIDVVLRPKELGQIRFEMITMGERIHIVVSAERADSMDLIRRNVDQLMADLRQSGFNQATLGFGGWAAQDQSGTSGQTAASKPESVALTKDFSTVLTNSPQRPTAEGRLDLRL